MGWANFYASVRTTEGTKPSYGSRKVLDGKTVTVKVPTLPASFSREDIKAAANVSTVTVSGKEDAKEKGLEDETWRKTFAGANAEAILDKYYDEKNATLATDPPAPTPTDPPAPKKGRTPSA